VTLTFDNGVDDSGAGTLVCDMTADTMPRVERLRFEQPGDRPTDPGAVRVEGPGGTSMWTWTRAAGRTKATARACLTNGSVAITLDRWPVSGTRIVLPESLGTPNVTVSIRDGKRNAAQSCKPGRLRIEGKGFTCREVVRVAVCYRDSSARWHQAPATNERCDRLDPNDTNVAKHKSDALGKESWECGAISLCR
jgi:hypothetical protein